MSGGAVPGTCGLLDEWGIFVQGLLGLSAFCVLIYKRYKEVPRRPLRIWLFDTSKQAIGNFAIHFMNVFSSNWFSDSTTDRDPCTWYILSTVLDSTLGLAGLILLLKMFNGYVDRRGISLLHTGDYGIPPKFKAWFLQMSAYLVLLVFNKLLVIFIMLIPFWETVGDGIRSVISKLGEKGEAVFTMLVLPFVVSALIFWVVDNYLKDATQPSGRSFSYAHLSDSQDEEGGDPGISGYGDDGDSAVERLLLSSSSTDSRVRGQGGGTIVSSRTYRLEDASRDTAAVSYNQAFSFGDLHATTSASSRAPANASSDQQLTNRSDHFLEESPPSEKRSAKKGKRKNAADANLDEAREHLLS